jgi:uncharacterized protein YgbK (DUF1537 family)
VSNGPMTPRSLEELLVDQPPEGPVPADAGERCRRSFDNPRTIVLALDDDPTGTQVVHDVPVATAWEFPDLEALLDDPSPLKFVLTNSRSLDRADAVVINEVIADRTLELAGRRGVSVEFVSRSDSTLRGHFPAETDTLRETARRHGVEPDVVVICPAFPEAGRITVGGTHWVRVPDGYVQAGSSEFARDATFGYASSTLAGWVAERTNGAIPAEAVDSITLTDLREGGPDHVGDLIAGLPTGAVVAADAVTDGDLAVLSLGLAIARERGRRILHRSGPSVLAPLVGMQRAEPLSVAELAAEIRAQPRMSEHGGGITVVGSHTSVSTGQLDELIAVHGPTHVEMEVDAVLDDAGAEIERVVSALAPHRADDDVVVSTSRTRRDASTPEASLALSRAVGSAIVEVVRRTVEEVTPAYLVAKGGITSSDVATEALAVRRATVIGQMIVGGLSVWRLPEDSRCPGLPYVIFPGNVGDRHTLAAVVGKLKEAVAAAT